MSRLRRSLGQTLVPLVAFVALTHIGCASSIAAKYPHLDRRAVCLVVPGIESDATEWIYDENGKPISNFHPELIDRMAPTTRTVFEFDPDANRESVTYLPAPHNQLQCRERFSILPSSDPHVSPLPKASLDLHAYKRFVGVRLSEDVVKKLAGCARQSAPRLKALSYSMSVNVYLTDDGHPVSALVERSTLGDRDLEACIAGVLRQTSWPAEAAAEAVAPASKMFFADGPSNLPTLKDLLTEIQRGTPSAGPPGGQPGGLRNPYVVTLPLGPLIVGIGVGVTIFLLPRETAPRCAAELNPITRQPYTSIEECEQVKRLSPEEILKRQAEHIKATQPQAPPAPAPQPQPQPQPQPAQPNCPRNERFIPERTDDARGCRDKNGNLQCYSARHYPCKGVHTRGIFTYQEMRGGICKKIEKPKAVRCEGAFIETGPCGSVSTTMCGDEGTATAGIYLKRERLDTP